MKDISRIRILCMLCLGILFLIQTFANSSEQDQIAKARQLISDRKYSEARQALSTLASNPNLNSDISAEAQYLIGCAYKDEDDISSAIQALDKVVKDYPDNIAWCCTAMLLEGECQLSNKQYTDAINTFKTIISNYSAKKGICLDAKMDLVQTLMLAGKIGGVTAMWSNLDKIAADYQSDAEISAYIELLKSRYGKNKEMPDFSEAAAMFRSLKFDSGPVNISNMSSIDIERLADQSYARSNYPRALQIYTDYYTQKLDCKEHAECRAANVRAMFRIVDCYTKLRDYDNAKTWLQRILSGYPSDNKACSEVYMSLAEFYERENKTSEALRTYDSVVEKYPSEAANCANALLLKGRLQQRLGKNYDCIKTYQLLIEKYPDQNFAQKDGKVGLAYAYALTERVNEAISIIDQLCKDNLLSQEEKLGLLYWKATTQIKAGKRDDYRKTMQDISANYRDKKAVCRKADLELASVLTETGKWDEALLILNQIRNDKNYSHEDQANIMMLTGYIDSSKAEEAFSIVISEYSDLPVCQQAYMHRANSRIKRGAYSEAMSDIRMIQVPCWKYFAEGECYFAQEKYMEAAASYSKVQQNYKKGEMPGDVPEVALLHLVECLNNLGNTDEAIKTLKTSLATEYNPEKKALILLQMANVYYAAKRYYDAIEVFKKVWDIEGAPEDIKAAATFKCGMCYHELTFYDSARTYISKVIELYSNSIWASFAQRTLSEWDKYQENVR